MKLGFSHIFFFIITLFIVFFLLFWNINKLHNQIISQNHEITTLKTMSSKTTDELAKLKQTITGGGSGETDEAMNMEQAFLNQGGNVSDIIGNLTDANNIFGQLLREQGDNDEESGNDEEVDGEVTASQEGVVRKLGVIEEELDNADKLEAIQEEQQIVDEVDTVETDSNVVGEVEGDIVGGMSVVKAVVITDDNKEAGNVEEDNIKTIELTKHNVNLLKLDELKSYLKEKGLSVSGNKKQLINRLEQHI